MAARLRPAKHRREAGIGALENLAPLVARFRLEAFRELSSHLRPARAVVLRGVFVNPQSGKQLLEKLVLDGADGNVLAILGLVDVVPGRAGVENIACSLLTSYSWQESPRTSRQAALHPRPSRRRPPGRARSAALRAGRRRCRSRAACRRRRSRRPG